MLRSIILGVILTAILIASSCKKTTTSTTAHPHLIFKFVYDSTQVRLDSIGNPATMPAGHAGQNPQMNWMSAHYIELAPTSTTQLGAGTVLYQTPMTTAGGTSAIDFAQENLTANNRTFYSVALDSITPGTYQWLRVSLAYQNYSVKLYYDTNFTYSYAGYNIPIAINQELPCTIASFIGANSYISSYKIKTQTIAVNGNKLQGYWGFESIDTFTYTAGGNSALYPYSFVQTGQAAGTTVVNPIASTSPIPRGSCVVTGQFNGAGGTPLTITGHETSDIVVTVSVSTNHSFEWVDVIPDGLWQPTRGENIVDMGIRGMIPTVGH